MIRISCAANPPSAVSPQGGVAFGSTTPTSASTPASPAEKSAKSDEARALEAMKKVGRLTTNLRNRDVLKEIQQKKESAGSRRMQIAAAAAQAAAIAKQQANEEKRTQLVPSPSVYQCVLMSLSLDASRHASK